MKKVFFNLSVLLALCVCLGFYSCSSSNDDEVLSKPTGVWYGTDAKSGWSCGAQFETYKINSKDSTLCTLTVEDVTNTKVYTLIGGVSFDKNKNVATVTFAKTTDGPTAATLTYKGASNLAVVIAGGTIKYGDYTISKTSSNLTSVAGAWLGSSCSASFNPYIANKDMTATFIVTSGGTSTTYSGIYTYDKSSGKGTFTDSATKVKMTFSTSKNSTTDITTLTMVNSTASYALTRYVVAKQ
jgi:hypothetical protein